MKKAVIIFVIILAVIALLLCHQHGLTAEQILSWQPRNLFVAALVLLMLYAVKSVLVFVPIIPLQILAGHLYSRETAILLNTLGLAVVMAVPYWIGKRYGAARMKKLLERHPNLKAILQSQQDNEMALCFLLRGCAVPPPDLVTMCLGAVGVPFVTNVIGGVFGCFPSVLFTTFLGANIRNPQSPAFWQALILNIAWIALSALSYWLFSRFHAVNRKEERK